MDLWTADLTRNPRDFEAAWKLARADYWIGRHLPNAQARAVFENGIGAGRTAEGLQPNRPEGHFWAAANMGELASASGLREGLRYRGTIKQELETVLRLDPGFGGGSADRALGRWYFKVPRLFGGSHREAEAHLRASLRYAPQSTVSHYFLAEVLIDDGRTKEARAELQQILDAPIDPEWAPEDREFKTKAQSLLARLESTR